MSLAVIKTGGKQYVAEPGKEIKIEKIKGKKEGDKVTFDRVLLLEEKGRVKIGSPFLEKAKVEGEVVEKGKEKKITVLKFKSKSHYKRKKGHRQPYMKVKIGKITS